MVNEILSVFDEAIHDKCWIDIYGRLAITGKQKVGERWKRFPVSSDIINGIEDCENLTEYFKVLSPDDTKKAIAFWKTLVPVKTSKVPGISAVRNIKKAETVLQFVVWLNVKKVSGIMDNSNWGTVINGIVKDAYKTIDCKNGFPGSTIDGITNLKVDVTEIGDIESWRKAMAEYTIDNIEAVSVWPFAGFTLTCKLSFLVRGDCMAAFTCPTEITCEDTFFVLDENTNILWDGTNQIIQ